MIVKVKEPQPLGVAVAPPGPGRLHLLSLRGRRAADRAMHRQRDHGHRLRDPARRRGRLPLLTPMSEVAGRMSIQEGAKFLERPQEGRGILLGGVPGVRPADVAILGGGVVGTNAAKVAAGLGANVPHPRHQPGPTALPGRHHAPQRDHDLFRPAHDPRVASSGRTWSSARC